MLKCHQRALTWLELNDQSCTNIYTDGNTENFSLPTTEFSAWIILGKK